MALTSCGEKGSIDMDGGSGWIRYDGKTYTVDISTILTSGPASDGSYSHHVSFVSTDTGNFFAFEVVNNSSASDIPAGIYAVTANENQASFSVKPDGATSFTGHPTGTMTVTKSGEAHDFTFEGTDSTAGGPARNVSFRFAGQLVRTNI